MPKPAPEARVEVGRKVQAFYQNFSYPGYDDLDSLDAMIRRATENGYVKMLDEQIPVGVRIADVGCGTGQLPLFLSVGGRRVIGADFSLPSLRKGNAFRRRSGLRSVAFCQTDIFDLALPPERFDYVFSVGVLHHTADPRRAFANVARLVKPGGYVIIGLYNTYGRLLLDARRLVFRLTGGRGRGLDAFVRGSRFGRHKKAIWYADQYEHPHESKHTVDEVLRWFDEEGIDFVNALPKIRFGEALTPDEQLFEPRDCGTKVEHLVCQLGWIFTQGKDGGFFILIGHKPAA